MTDEQATGAAEGSLDVLPDSIRAWWTEVLAGQADASHPVHGGNLKTRLEGETLIISGTVATEEDRNGIAAETAHLKGHGISAVRNELEILPDVTDERDLLIQTLVGIFENGEHAAFARDYLVSHPHVHPRLIQAIDSEGGGDGRAQLRSLLPEAFWDEAEKALEHGNALLILSVDETEAFTARELLADETRSLQTLILPPEAASNMASARRSLDRVTRTPSERESEEDAEAARPEALGHDVGVRER
jgi:hypothetical protein